MAGPLRLIITGATGFIGGHVVEAALARGHAVTAVAGPRRDHLGVGD